MALVLPLAGRQVWAQPIPIVENSNPDYQGVGCVMADGSYLHVWLDRAEILLKTRFMRYSAAHQELWPQPQMMADGYARQVHPTSDGGFLMIYAPTSGSMRIRKFGPDGLPLWNGVTHSLDVLSYNYQAVVAETATGGVWVVCNSEYRNVTYHYFSPTGVETVPGGTSITLAWDSYNLSLISCPSGGAVLSYIQNYQIRVHRIAQDQSALWDQTVSTQPANTYANLLLQDGPDSFYLLFGSSTLRARRYNYAGQQLWPADVQLSTMPLSGQSNWRAQRCGDGTLRLLSLSADGLHIDRIDAAGSILPALPVLEIPTGYGTVLREVIPLAGANNPAWLSYTVNTGSINKFMACRLDNTGWLDALPVQLASVSVTGTIYPVPWFGVVADDLLCVYPQHEPGQLFLKRTICSPTGDLEHSTLSTSVYGSFNQPVIAASPQQILCAWLETDLIVNNSHDRKRVRYQLFSLTGTPLPSEPGILPGGGSYGLTSDLKAQALPNGEYLLFWKETSSPNRIRAQQISATGVPLWEPEGRIILETAVADYSISQTENGIYIAFDGAGLIRLQKLVGGQAQWGLQGITMASGGSNGELPQLLTLRGDYLVYGLRNDGSMFTGYESIKVIRFGVEGEALPGFGDGGAGFAPLPDAIKVFCGASLLTPQGLILRLDHGFYGEDDQGPYMFINAWIGHLVGPEAQLPWGTGMPGFKGYLLGSDASGYFQRVWQMSQSWVKKVSYSGQQLWSGPCNIGGDKGDYGALQLADGTWIGLGLAEVPTPSPTLKYYSFGSDGGVQVPADSRLESRYQVNNAALATSGEAVYVLWGMSSGYSSEYTHLYLQKINAIPVANDDPVALPGPVKLLGIRPNPFAGETRIELECERSGRVELAVYNLRGQKVRNLLDGTLENGLHSIGWDGKDESGSRVASGIYFARLNADAGSPVTVKLLKLK